MSPSTNTNGHTNGHSADPEKQPTETPGGGVDVLSAELEFSELQRELTRQSRRSAHLGHEKNGSVDVASGKGSEGGSSSSDEDFDLEEYLRGQEEDGTAWRKKKRIGMSLPFNFAFVRCCWGWGD